MSIKVNYLIFFLAIHLFGSVSAQVDTLDLGNDTTLCEGYNILLHATTPGYDTYLWSTGSTEESILVTTSGEYWCKVTYTDSTNLVYNGNFNQGNVGFTTDYVPGVGGPWGLLSEEGTYEVGSNASSYHTNWPPCTDHTTGTGLYMIINGDSVPGENVWCQEVAIQANTKYIYSAWFSSISPDNPAVLNFNINGTALETVFLTNQSCLWDNIFDMWESEMSLSANFCIVNQNTALGGNDFGIDDIALYSYYEFIDTVVVTFVPPPEISLGNDTALCLGQVIPIDSGSGFDIYEWQDGSEDQIYYATQPGIYSVTVFDSLGCSNSDTIVIDQIPGPEISIGSDTSICQGESLTLSPGYQFSEYLWQDNSTLPFFTVTTTGDYMVVVKDNVGCNGEAEISVYVSDPQVDLGPDTTFCEGDTLVLDAGEYFNQYLWSNGSAEQTIDIVNPGNYSVEVVDFFSCEAYDEINLDQTVAPTADLGDDLIICEGDSIMLIGPEGSFQYYWNGDQGEQSLVVYSEGIYELQVVNSCGTATDEILATVYPIPLVDLGKDQIVFPGESITVSAPEGYDAYLWNDGSTNYYISIDDQNININDPVYHVEVENNSCKNSDSVRIEYNQITVPIVITPNGDLFNEIFSPDLTTWKGVNSHHISVFNRWGEKVWESDDFPSGWDGKVNGKNVAEGTYFWVLDVNMGPQNLSQTIRGSLTILK